MSATAEPDAFLDSQGEADTRTSNHLYHPVARVDVNGDTEGGQKGPPSAGMEEGDVNVEECQEEEYEEEEYQELEEEEYQEFKEEEYWEDDVKVEECQVEECQEEEYEEEEYQELEEEEYREFKEEEYWEYKSEEENGEREDKVVREIRENEDDEEILTVEDSVELLVGDREFRKTLFQTLFRDLLRLLLQRISYNDHTLVRTHTGQIMLRCRPRESENPGAREPESSEGENLAEGFLPVEPEELEQPTEEAAFQEARTPTGKARVREGEAITSATMSYKMGACAPNVTEVCKEQQNTQALVTSIETPGSLGNRSHDFTQAVKRRVNALKNLQAEYAQLEAQFYKDFYSLEMKYAAFFQPLFDKRSDIINAIYEPTEDEYQWEVGVQEGVGEAMKREPKGKLQINGVPHFWLTAFKNIKILCKLIQKNDELVLEYLKDVKIKFSVVEEPVTFTIEFFFKPNEYFFNEVLTKTYCIRSHPDYLDPFFSQGPEIIRSSGCEIYWKEGGNVIMETSNLQKFEGHGSVVSTKSKMPSYSFFTYFYPPDSPEGRLLGVATDYKLGYIFRELLVPKAILFFTKEAIECKSNTESEEAGSKEERKVKNSKPKRGPQKDPDIAEDSTGEPSWKT